MLYRFTNYLSTGATVMPRLALSVSLLAGSTHFAWSQPVTPAVNPPASAPTRPGSVPLPQPSTTPAAPSCNRLLHGHLVDAVTHEAIVGAQIAAHAAHAQADSLVLSDDTGHFSVEAMCHHAMLTITADSYQTYTYALAAAPSDDLELELVPLANETIEIHDHAPAPTELRAATTVTGAALQRTRGRNFTEALREVAGVSKLGSGSDAGKPVVRGLYGRRVALFVDGMRHRAQEWGLDHAPEIDPFAAGKLSVVRGTAAVEYGPDALGGVIAVEAPAMLHSPGLAAELHTIATVRGLGGTIAGRLRGRAHSAPAWGWTIDGSYRQVAAPSTPDYALNNTGSYEGNASAALAYERGSREFQLSLRHYQAKLGVCSCLRIDALGDFLTAANRAAPVDAPLYQSTFAIARPYQAVMHETVLARARLERPAGVWMAHYGYQFDGRREFDQVRSNITGPQFDFALHSHDAQLAFEHHPRHLGAQWHLRGKVGVRGEAALHQYEGLPLIPSYTAFGGAVFAQERLIGHDTELALGVRYDALQRTATIERQDYQRLVRSNQLTAEACPEGASEFACRSRFHLASASLGALHTVTKQWTLKGELSTAMRPPNPDEQYLNGTAPTFPVLGLGKPTLGAETTLAASATSEIRTRCFTGEASVFANQIYNYINFAPAIDAQGQPIFDVLIRGTFPRFITSPVDARFVGADGALQWQPHPALTLGAQAAMVRARKLTGGYLALIPANRARLTAQWQGAGWGRLSEPYVRLGTTLVARQARTDDTTDFVPAPPGYVIFDAELGANLRLGDEQLRLALSGSNLGNQRYRDYTSLNRYFVDQPGWQAALRLSWFLGTKE